MYDVFKMFTSLSCECDTVQTQGQRTIQGVTMIKEDILIKNTTREQREQIVNDALGIVDGLCDGCSQGIISMYDAYIDGLKELDEINREFNAHYEVDDKRGGNRGGCSMM